MTYQKPKTFPVAVECDSCLAHFTYSVPVSVKPRADSTQGGCQVNKDAQGHIMHEAAPNDTYVEFLCSDPCLKEMMRKEDELWEMSEPSKSGPLAVILKTFDTLERQDKVRKMTKRLRN